MKGVPFNFDCPSYLNVTDLRLRSCKEDKGQHRQGQHRWPGESFVGEHPPRNGQPGPISVFPLSVERVFSGCFNRLVMILGTPFATTPAQKRVLLRWHFASSAGVHFLPFVFVAKPLPHRVPFDSLTLVSSVGALVDSPIVDENPPWDNVGTPNVLSTDVNVNCG